VTTIGYIPKVIIPKKKIALVLDFQPGGLSPATLIIKLPKNPVSKKINNNKKHAKA
jgi:hypothetical protein